MIYLLMFLLIIDVSSQVKIHKQYMHTYYKTHSQVNPIRSPNNTLYDVYLEGKSSIIKVPSNLSMLDMVNCKVIGRKGNNIMFVVDEQPLILTSQGEIQTMSYKYIKLSGSLVPLGDDQALYVKTISNQGSAKPDREWNFLELLHFDFDRKWVGIISKIPWFSDDDWLHIKEWKLHDHIFFNDKLYLLVFRSLYNAYGDRETFNELSIISFCLNKGLQLLSYPIEVHFQSDQMKLHSNEPYIAVFHFKLGANVDDESKRYAIITYVKNIDNLTVYYINNLTLMFNQNSYNCANNSEAVRFSSFHDHIRFKESEKSCIQVIQDKCENEVFPSGRVHSVQSSVISSKLTHMFTLHLGLPLFKTIIYISNVEERKSCVLNSGLESLTCEPILFNDGPFHPQLYVNIEGELFAIKKSNEPVYIDFNCTIFSKCIHCVMFGHLMGCRWNQDKCEHNYYPGDPITNECIRIVEVTPKSITSFAKSLQIDMSIPLSFITKIRVSLGSENYCSDATKENQTIYCDLVLGESGWFPVNVTIYYDQYVDTVGVTTKTSDLLSVSRFDTTFWIFVIIAVILAVGFLFALYFITSMNLKNTSNAGFFSKLSVRSPSQGFSVTHTSSISNKTYEPSQTI